MSFNLIDKKFKKSALTLACLCCHGTLDVQLENSRTQYHWDGPIDAPDNPNRPVPLCRPCAQEHHEYWNDMWAEYRAGQL